MPGATSSTHQQKTFACVQATAGGTAAACAQAFGDAVIPNSVALAQVTESQVKQGADVIERHRCTGKGATGFSLEQRVSQAVVAQFARVGQGDALCSLVLRTAFCGRRGGQHFVAVRQVLPGPLLNILWGVFAGNVLRADMINLRQLIPTPVRVVWF